MVNCYNLYICIYIYLVNNKKKNREINKNVFIFLENLLNDLYIYIIYIDKNKAKTYFNKFQLIKFEEE